MIDLLQDNISRLRFKLWPIFKHVRSLAMNKLPKWGRNKFYPVVKDMKVLFLLIKDKKTVVFDLDETLIHCNDSLNVQYDVKLPIVFPTG